MSYETIDHIRFNDTLDGVIILDQTALPGAERYLCLTSLEEMTEAICSRRNPPWRSSFGFGKTEPCWPPPAPRR